MQINKEGEGTGCVRGVQIKSGQLEKFDKSTSWKTSLYGTPEFLASQTIFLKLVFAIFYQIFIFSPNDSPLETMRNVFYFIQKALFVLKIFKFL